MKGLFAVSFRTPLGEGTGVVIAVDNEVFGGDQAYAYSGTFTQTGNAVSATLRVRRHTPTADQSVFGGIDSFTLRLSGDATTLQFTGTSAEVPNVSIGVTLRQAPSSNSVNAWKAFLGNFGI